jgi:hypothetical protein
MPNRKSSYEEMLKDFETKISELSKKTPDDKYLVVEINKVFVKEYQHKESNLVLFYGVDVDNMEEPAVVACHPTQINARITYINKTATKAKKMGFRISE